MSRQRNQESRIPLISQSKSAVKSVLRLTLVLAVGWIICFWPARLIRPETGVQWMSIAAICCLVPGWIVVLLEWITAFPNALAVMLAQTAVRMVAVGTAVVVVKQNYPKIGFADFFGWLVGFYLLALFVEVQLLRSGEGVSAESGSPAEEPNSITSQDLTDADS